MNFDYKRGWALVPEAEPGSFDRKAPYVDNGTGRSDRERYFDPEFMRLEWERMWTKTWLLAGPEVDVAQPGDMFRFDIGRESFIIVRDSDGHVRAHYNVCPHRGSRILLADHGYASEFSCPFHAWTFDLTGTLKEVRDAETFRPEALCLNLDMKSVRCEVVAGLVFITLNDDVPPAREWLGVVGDHIEAYDINAMKVVQHKRSEWAANWKGGIDAFLELYHLATVHPQTQGFMDDYHGQYDLFQNGHSRHLLYFAKPSPRFPDQGSINEGIAMMLRDVGIDPETFPGSAGEARAAIIEAKRELSRKYELGYDRFTDSQLVDNAGYSLFPNVALGLHPEAIFIMRFLPHPTHPERFYYDNIILYRNVDDPGYKVPYWIGLPTDTDLNPEERPGVQHYAVGEPAELGPVLDQDVELVKAVQEGAHSRSFDGPLWGEQEVRIRHYHAELNRFLGEASDGTFS